MQRPIANNPILPSLIHLTPLPGRLSPRQGNVWAQCLIKEGCLWICKGDDGNVEMDDGTQGPPKIDAPGTNAPTTLVHKSANPSFKIQFHGVISQLHCMQQELKQLPNIICIDKVHSTAQQVSDLVHKLTTVTATREDLANHPTFHFVNRHLGDLQDRLNALEERSDPPLSKRELGLLGFAVSQMR